MRFPKPFFRKDRKLWYVQFGGKQINLGPDKDEAFETYKDLVAEYRPGETATPRTDVTVIEVVDRFIEHYHASKPGSTFRWYQCYCDSFVKHVGEDLTVRRLIPNHITAWIDANPEWSSSTRYGAISAVKRAFWWATDEGLIDSNPIARVRKPKPGNREEILTPAQLKAVFNEADTDFRLFLFVLAEQGCRSWELRRVEARHFKVDRGTWEFPVPQSKGKRKSRVIYLTPKVMEITKRLAELRPIGPLFVSNRGVPWTKSAIVQRMETIRRNLKLPAGVVTYTIRHTFATEALVNGTDVVTLAELMGHSGTKMISEVYGHLSKRAEDMRRVAERTAIVTPADESMIQSITPAEPDELRSVG